MSILPVQPVPTESNPARGPWAAILGPWIATLSGSDGYLYDDVADAIEADHIDISVVRASAAPVPDECCDDEPRMPSSYRPADVLYRVDDSDLGEDDEVRMQWDRAQYVARALNREATQGDHPHAELITALLGLVDTLISHPEMPMPRHSLTLSGCMTVIGDEEESLSRVQLAAEILGVPVKASYSPATHSWHHTATVDGPVRICLSHLVDAPDPDGGAS